MEKIRKLSSYEKLMSVFYVIFKVKITKIYEKDKYIYAIKKLTQKYPYLMSKFNSDGSELILSNELIPKIHFYDKNLNDDEFTDILKDITKDKNEYTNEYIIYFNYENNESIITGIYNHGCCEALSTFHLCDELCLFLSDESLPINPKLIIPSVHEQIINNKPNPIPFEKYLDKDILFLPHVLHSEEDTYKIKGCSYYKLLKNDEFKPILTFCHDNSITIQSLLWYSCLLCQIKLFDNNIFNYFPLKIRYFTTALLTNRLEFCPFISEDDLCNDVGVVYINQLINKNDNVFKSLLNLSKDLKDEINNKQQFYDFLSMKNDTSYPCYTSLSTTLGILKNKSNYNNEFDVKDAVFISIPILSILKTNFIVHTYTYQNIGCYFCCSYTYPHFNKDEIIKFVDNIIKVMKMICDERNKEIIVDDLLKIIDL